MQEGDGIETKENEEDLVDIDPNDEDIKKRITNVIEIVREFNIRYKETRKTVKEQLEKMVHVGVNEYKMEPMHLRDLIDITFKENGVSMSYLRKLLPDILKYTSKGRLDYKHKRELEQQREQQTQGSVQRLENELKKAIEETKELQKKVQKLGQEFLAKATLVIRGNEIPIVARIDPVKKGIISIEVYGPWMSKVEAQSRNDW